MWKKLKTALLVIVIIIASLIAIGVASAYWDDYRDRQENLSFQRTYLGISIGEGTEEVLYKLGRPTQVVNKTIDGKIVVRSTTNNDAASLKADEKIEDFEQWIYTNGNGETKGVHFDEQRKVEHVFCIKSDYGYCPFLAGVAPGTQEYTIIEDFGQPTRTVLKDGEKKIIYEKQNLIFNLSKEAVFGIVLGAASNGYDN